MTFSAWRSAVPSAGLWVRSVMRRYSEPDDRYPGTGAELVRHLRKNEYQQAVQAMSDLIKREPQVAAHYRFRAELLRIWGKLDRARRDYRKMTELEPEMAVGWNGLAEVELRGGDAA